MSSIGAWCAAMWLALSFVLAPAVAADEPLERAHAQAQRLVLPAGTVALAAVASQEGHWTFVNKKGERFTAANAEEMARLPGVLAPGVEARKLVLVVTAGSVFEPAKALGLLPREAALRLSTAVGVYPVTAGAPRTVQVSPKLRVAIGERADFDEILAQLDKSLARGGIRVLALEPGGPAALPRRAALAGKAKGDLVERIEPVRLMDAFAALRGQTAVVTGRLEGRFLNFQVAGGPDRSLAVEDLTSAAAANDANMIILDAPAGRQPGARNWLWLKAEVQGVDALHPDAGLDVLLDTLATEARPLSVALTRRDPNRVVLVATPGTAAAPKSAGGIGDAIGRMASDLSNQVTGRIEPTAIHMHLVSAARQRELDRRLIRWLPAWVSWGYVALSMLGALGSAVSLAWWQKIWPPEAASDYPNALGLQAARAIRLAAYALLFMPAVAVAAAPAILFRRPKPRAS